MITRVTYVSDPRSFRHTDDPTDMHYRYTAAVRAMLQERYPTALVFVMPGQEDGTLFEMMSNLPSQAAAREEIDAERLTIDPILNTLYDRATGAQ